MGYVAVRKSFLLNSYSQPHDTGEFWIRNKSDVGRRSIGAKDFSSVLTTANARCTHCHSVRSAILSFPEDAVFAVEAVRRDGKCVIRLFQRLAKAPTPRLNVIAQCVVIPTKIRDNLFGNRSPSRRTDFMHEERSSGFA